MSFHNSIRRKIAIATWNRPKEGNIYGKLSIDATNALKYIDYLRDKLQKKITITHLVGKAVGLSLAKCPDINGRIFLGKYYPHKTADVSFLVALEEGKNLERLKVSSIDKKSLSDIADELSNRSKKLKTGGDKDHERSKPLIKFLPTFLIKPLLSFFGYLSSCAGIDLKFVGVKKFPFGACIITNVGMFGLDEAFAPPVTFAHVPAVLTMPAIKEKAVVENSQIVIRPILDLMATIDHRYLDGFRGAMIAQMIKDFMQNPWTMDGIETPFSQ